MNAQGEIDRVCVTVRGLEIFGGGERESNVAQHHLFTAPIS